MSVPPVPIEATQAAGDSVAEVREDLGAGGPLVEGRVGGVAMLVEEPPLRFGLGDAQGCAHHFDEPAFLVHQVDAGAAFGQYVEQAARARRGEHEPCADAEAGAQPGQRPGQVAARVLRGSAAPPGGARHGPGARRRAARTPPCPSPIPPGCATRTWRARWRRPAVPAPPRAGCCRFGGRSPGRPDSGPPARDSRPPPCPGQGCVDGLGALVACHWSSASRKPMA